MLKWFCVMSEQSANAADSRFLLDAMVLASGLTSKREPPSYSRRLVEMAIDGALRLVVTDRVIEETRAVIVNPRFVDHVTESTADQLLGLLVAAAEVTVHDAGIMAARLTADPHDDYLAAAAIQTGAFLVTRDARAGFQRVSGLNVGPPGTALRRIRGPGSSLLGVLRDKVTRWPDDTSWARLRQAAWDTPDPDRERL